MTTRLDIPITRGLDQSADARVLPPGAMVELADWRFDKAGRLAQRYGSELLSDLDTYGGAVGVPLRMFSRGDELCCVATSAAGLPTLYSWSVKHSRWSPVSVVPRPSAPVRRVVSRDAYFQYWSQSASISGVTVTAWTESAGSWYGGGQQFWGRLMVQVRDDATGAVLSHSLVSAATNYPSGVRVFTNGAQAYVAWTEGASGGTGTAHTLYCTRVDVAAGSFAPAAPTTIGATVGESVITAWHAPFDACAVAGGTDVVFAWQLAASASIHLERRSSALVFAASSTQATGAAASSGAELGLGICAVSGERIWVAYSNATDGLRWYTSSVTTCVTATGPTLLLDPVFGVCGMIGLVRDPSSATTAHVTVGHSSGTPYYVCDARHYTVTTGGVSTLIATTHQCVPCSRPFVTADTIVNVSLVTCTTVAGAFGYETIYLARLGQSQMYLEAVLGTGASAYSQLYRNTGFGMCDWTAGDADAGEWVSSYPQLYRPPQGTQNSAGAGWGYLGSDRGQAGTEEFRLSFGTVDRYLPVTLGDTVFLTNCGVTCYYDGQRVAECNFAQAPVVTVGAETAGAGPFLVGEVRSYLAVHEQVDGTGRRHYSVPGPAQQWTVLGANVLSVALTVTNATLTNRDIATSGASASPIETHIYRTVNGGTTYYRITNGASPPLANNPLTATGAYQDAATDASIADNDVLYVMGGIVPAAFCVAGAHGASAQGRVFLAAGTRVVCSTLQDASTAAQFPDDEAFAVDVVATGRVTALAALDDAVLAWTRTDAYVIGGDGPDNQGVGAFSLPRQIPNASGCNNARSLAAYRDGVLVQSPQGIEVIPRGFGPPVWLGEQVRDQVAVPISGLGGVSSVVVSPVERVIRITQDGSKLWLVYDYERGAWYTETSAQALSGATWWPRTTGRYVYGVATGTALYHYRKSDAVADATATTPTKIIASLQTGWLRPGGVYGQTRFYRVRLLGEWRENCSLTVTVLRDDQQGLSDSVTFDLESETNPLTGVAYAAGDAVALAWELPQQQAASIQIRVTAAVSTGTSAGIVLNALSVEFEPTDKARVMTASSSH